VTNRENSRRYQDYILIAALGNSLLKTPPVLNLAAKLRWPEMSDNLREVLSQ
jgi:hypothetical protein